MKVSNLFLHSFLLFIISLTISHEIWVTGFQRRNIHIAKAFFTLVSQCLRVTLLLLRSPTRVVKLCSPHWVRSSRCNIFSCVFGCFVQPTEYWIAMKYSKIKRAMPATQRNCQIMLVVSARFRGQCSSCRSLLFSVVAKLAIANKHWWCVHTGHY